MDSTKTIEGCRPNDGVENDEQNEVIGSNGITPGSSLTRTKPCMEIYRPPNLRKGGRNFLSSCTGESCLASADEQQQQHAFTKTKDTHKRQTKHGRGCSEQLSQDSNSSSSSSSTNESNLLVDQQKPRKFNVNAKEFCLPSTAENPASLPSARFPSRGIEQNRRFQTVDQILKQSSQQQNSNSPIMQSKSMGNVREQQNEKSRPVGILTSTFLRNNPQTVVSVSESTPKIPQSKSSGNIHGKSRVHFQDDDSSGIGHFGVAGAAAAGGPRFESNNAFELIKHDLASLQLTGEPSEESIHGKTGFQPWSNNTNPGPMATPRLQKSRTVLHVPQQQKQKISSTGAFQLNQQQHNLPYLQQLGQTNLWFQHINNLQQHQRPVSFPSGSGRNLPVYATVGNSSNPVPVNQQQLTHSQMKRSKSFHNSTQFRQQQQNVYRPNFTEFEISKWPKPVQEMVTTVVTGLDRNLVTTKHKIEMVAQIFSTLFNGEEAEALLLISPSINIFIYFLLKEQQNLTVSESLLNTVFATFQRLVQQLRDLAQEQCRQSTKSELKSYVDQWNRFLKFLSGFYTQLKVLRIQQVGQEKKPILDETSFKFLSLLCDICLVILSSQTRSVMMSCDLIDHVFIVMTSIGRDMEMTFPLKMKKILATVRDVLLGVGPFNDSKADAAGVAHVQKALMQLIELHAANWNLTASAVRYYYK